MTPSQVIHTASYDKRLILDLWINSEQICRLLPYGLPFRGKKIRHILNVDQHMSGRRENANYFIYIFFFLVP